MRHEVLGMRHEVYLRHEAHQAGQVLAAVTVQPGQCYAVVGAAHVEHRPVLADGVRGDLGTPLLLLDDAASESAMALYLLIPKTLSS